MFGGPYGAVVLVLGLVFLTGVAVGIVCLYRRKAESANSPVEQEDDPFAAAMSGKSWAEVAEAHIRSY